MDGRTGAYDRLTCALPETTFGNRMSRTNQYNEGLDQNTANYAALSPTVFLRRSAEIYPNRTSVVEGERRFTWSETYARCRRLASALGGLGILEGDTVATMLLSVPEMYEAHFGIPMAGAVINAINVRLNPQAIAFILKHSETKLLLVDPEFGDVVSQALALLDIPPPIIVDVPDPAAPARKLIGRCTYESMLAAGDPQFELKLPRDEWDAIAIGYTSGTTGDPKGVVTHHRGAYLNAVGNILTWQLPTHSVYLWTLPMFHCNGWCFPWTLAAVGGTSVCLRRVDAAPIFDLIRKHQVTHYCGAPVVHAMLADSPEEVRAGVNHLVKGLIAGAAPPSGIFERMERIGFELTHVYGLTETYAPASVCTKQVEWDELSPTERAKRNSRQGVVCHLQDAIDVLDPTTMQPVPRDGTTVGEIMFRGNITMKGYLKNPKATREAFAGGWFHTGDLGIIDPDGYVKVTDRSKDVIISGGENISSLEVEEILQSHPAVQQAAVVAMADEKWGEVPAAFVELRSGKSLDETELRQFCHSSLARYKVPKKFIFGPLIRTSVGKVQKFRLRELLKPTTRPEPQ
jgi:fatty-acyl-CoA synthase